MSREQKAYEKRCLNLIQIATSENPPLEDILNGLASVGYDPSLIYDDDGRWICDGITFSNIHEPGGRFEGMIFVEEDERWFSNPRKAVEHYFKQWYKDWVKEQKREKDKINKD